MQREVWGFDVNDMKTYSCRRGFSRPEKSVFLNSTLDIFDAIIKNYISAVTAFPE